MLEKGPFQALYLQSTTIPKIIIFGIVMHSKFEF